MKIKHLLEGTTPNLPGAFRGVQVMTPQQFLAKAGDEPEQEVDEALVMPMSVQAGQEIANLVAAHPYITASAIAAAVAKYGYDKVKKQLEKKKLEKQKGVAEGSGFDNWANDRAASQLHKLKASPASSDDGIHMGAKVYHKEHQNGEPFKVVGIIDDQRVKVIDDYGNKEVMFINQLVPAQGVAEGFEPGHREIERWSTQSEENQKIYNAYVRAGKMADEAYKQNDGASYTGLQLRKKQIRDLIAKKMSEQDVTEGQEHLERIRKLSGLDEATKLPAQQREFGGQEFQDYMKRIVGTPDVDKQGNVKVDKKGVEKYVSGKTKGDKYKMPYIHRSSVVEYLGPDGQTYDEDKVKQTLAIRPKSLLKQNEKMKHSNGELEQFFNIGFAALTGIALDESTNKLIIVNTCPGAGSCKVDCFAMKGGKIQFKAAWQSDGRILTYLLNDPDGFFNQLSAEISKEERLGQKGGYNVTIRWHDAGDFFSPEYQDLAFKLAEKHPNVKFYAYTKMAGAALGQKPSNFIINWSEGAHTSQEKQVKAQDPTLSQTKNSRIVPTDLFGDLLAKDAKGNLAKGPGGQWVIVPDKLPELKQRLAKEYGLSASSILGYDEWAAKTDGGKKETPVKYNVIIAPGEPDLTANSHGVLSTLLLRH